MLRRLLLAATALSLASCAGSVSPPLPQSATPMRATLPFANSGSCYVTRIQPQIVKATITFYGWPDNTPPGNAIAHPVIHNVASGDGTYCNPTTFATEPSNDRVFPYGVKIYVPFLKQYFIREDDCTASGPPTGSGSNGCYKIWFDLWIGGNGSSKVSALVRCERSLTPNAKVDVIVWPQANLPVQFPGPIYRNSPKPDGTCYGKRSTTLPN
jgi:hypothetical protein